MRILFQFGLGIVFLMTNFAFAKEDFHSRKPKIINLLDLIVIKDYKCHKHHSHCKTGPVGPQGPVGPTGPTGPTGPQGPAGTVATSLGSFYSDTLTRQLVNANNPVLIQFDGEYYPPIGIIPSSNPPTLVPLLYDTFTVTADGIYLITWAFNITPSSSDSSGNTYIAADVLKTGQSVFSAPAKQTCIAAGGGAVVPIASYLSGSVSVALVSGDYIQLQVQGLGFPNTSPDKFAEISEANLTITQIGLSSQ